MTSVAVPVPNVMQQVEAGLRTSVSCTSGNDNSAGICLEAQLKACCSTGGVLNEMWYQIYCHMIFNKVG